MSNITLINYILLLKNGGEFMDKVIVIYEVEDYDEWRHSYDDNTANRKIHGSRESYIHRSKENPNELVLIYKWDTADNAREHFESEEVKNKMKDAGVKGEPVIYYVDEIERTIA